MWLDDENVVRRERVNALQLSDQLRLCRTVPIDIVIEFSVSRIEQDVLDCGFRGRTGCREEVVPRQIVAADRIGQGHEDR